ncbi:lysophospholipid acyltransferase family protein [Subtercola sp. YIM 133946]|uniref:lysophospholipid acyltransferase family protein n=1 Tax=Subtercola sp. YIM 133946 TaxID=3118909 RepID=UPI002F92E1E9
MAAPTRAAVRLLVNPVVRGREYLAELPGPFVFVANHPSELDAPLVSQVLSGLVPRLVSVSAAPATGIRERAERSLGLRSASTLRALLERGVSVLLFPENRRADDGSLQPFNLGAAQLGIRAGVPIVPVTIVGSYRALPPWRRLPEPSRPRVDVIFGRPIQVTSGSEPRGLNEQIVTAITLGLAEARQGWYGALRAEADGTLGDAGATVADGVDAARWRRVWKATQPDTTPRRTVWVK